MLRKLLIIVVFCAPMLVYMDAHATDRWHGGSMCRSKQNNAHVFPAYSSSGIANYTTTDDITAVCPVRWEGTDGTVTNNPAALFRVWYRDLNNDATNGGFSCTVAGADSAGTYWAGATRHSCATVGGCLSADPTYVSPVGVKTYLEIPGPGSAFVFSTSLVLRCSLTRVSPTSQISTLFSYFVRY